MGWYADRRVRQYKASGVKSSSCDCYFPAGGIRSDPWPMPYNWMTKCSQHQHGYEASQTPDGTITVTSQAWGF